MLEEVHRRRITLPHSGLETALLDWGGDGPLALLHHANGFCAALWDELARILRSDFHVVAMDARGHGDSDPPAGDEDLEWRSLSRDAAAVAEILVAESGAKSVGLALGHSFGGTLLLAAAASRPGLFERALFVDPVILPPMSVVAARERMEDIGLATRTLKRKHRWKSREEARAYLAERPLFANWREPTLDLYVAEGLRERSDGEVELKCSREVEAAIYAGDHDLDTFGTAPTVRIPVRLLWAEGGDFPREIYQVLAERLVCGSVVDVEGGHLVLMEAPERVADAVTRFVSEPFPS